MAARPVRSRSPGCCDGRRLLRQLSGCAPPGKWKVWLILAGRGFGKTRSGVEWVREQVEGGAARRIALVAETATDARTVMYVSIRNLCS